MPELDPNITKDAVKEALKEWLNEQFAAFGKWTLTGLLFCCICRNGLSLACRAWFLC